MANSLFLVLNSLFFKIFSLLICVGNCAKSDCGAAVSCCEIGLGSPEIAKFPVKFPVSRECAWRRVRSALRRQPGIPASRSIAESSGERPAISGLSRNLEKSPGGEIGPEGCPIRESLRRAPAEFPFSGDSRRRHGSIATGWGPGVDFSPFFGPAHRAEQNWTKLPR